MSDIDLTSDYLVIHEQGAMPWNLDNGTCTLAEAIIAEVNAFDATSDHYDGTEADLERFRAEMLAEALAALGPIDSSYRDPTKPRGVLWTIDELADDDRIVTHGWGI